MAGVPISPAHTDELALAVGVGFSLGLYLVVGFAFGLPLAPTSPALVEVHGQVQLFGFVGLFIMAVAVQLIPRFHASRMARRTGACRWAGFVARSRPRADPRPAAAAGRRWGVAPLRSHPAGAERRSGAGRRAPGSPGLRTVDRSGRQASASWDAAARRWAAAWFCNLILNPVACTSELAQGALVVPYAQDEALLHLELWGFASTMVLAVSGRVFPKFLLLQPTREGMARSALALWAVGSFGVPLVWRPQKHFPALRTLFAVAPVPRHVLRALRDRLAVVRPTRPRASAPHT